MSRMSHFWSRTMSRREIDAKMSSQMLKLAESTVHTELSQFLFVRHMATCLGGNPILIEIGPKNLERDGRPAGRTHIAKFYSNGQPSVATSKTPQGRSATEGCVVDLISNEIWS